MAPYSAQTTGQLSSYDGSQQCILTSEEIGRAALLKERRSRVNKTRSSVIGRLQSARMLKKNAESAENTWTSQTKKDKRSKFLTVKSFIGIAPVSSEYSALKERRSRVNETHSSVIGRLQSARMFGTNSESVENVWMSQTKKNKRSKKSIGIGRRASIVSRKKLKNNEFKKTVIPSLLDDGSTSSSDNGDDDFPSLESIDRDAGDGSNAFMNAFNGSALYLGEKADYMLTESFRAQIGRAHV